MPKIGRILIVEDENAIRQSLQRFLEKAGFVAQAVSSASEAMARLAQDSVDVCLTDINLPDYEAAEWIPGVVLLYPKLEWVLYTGTVAYSLPEKILGAGIKKEHLFYKPALSLSRLQELLSSLCCKVG